jgi:Arc/MetJ-type ribon-helix-helix transcriptional regulator
MLDRFCRDLRDYLRDELLLGRNVVVRIGRLVDRCGFTPQCIGAYTTFLRRLLGNEYRVARGVYNLPREVALSIYNNLDKLCEELKTRRKAETRRGMVTISFHIPQNMLHMLDEMAKKTGISRSELVRDAIRRMLERMRGSAVCITLTPEEEEMLWRLVSRGIYSSIEEAIHDAVRQLAQRLGSA